MAKVAWWNRRAFYFAVETETNRNKWINWCRQREMQNTPCSHRIDICCQPCEKYSIGVLLWQLFNVLSFVCVENVFCQPLRSFMHAEWTIFKWFCPCIPSKWKMHEKCRWCFCYGSPSLFASGHYINHGDLRQMLSICLKCFRKYLKVRADACSVNVGMAAGQMFCDCWTKKLNPHTRTGTVINFKREN